MLRQWRRYHLLLKSNQPKQVHSPDRVLYQWYHVDSQIPPLLGDMFRDLFSCFTPIWERVHKIPIFPTDCFKDCFCSIIKNGYVLWLSKKILAVDQKNRTGAPEVAFECLSSIRDIVCLESSGQIIATSDDLTPNGGLVRATPLQIREI